MSLPLSTCNYGKMQSLVKSCIINGDKQLIQDNINNSAWIMEYVSIFFTRHNCEMFCNEWTVLRVFKKFAEYYYNILPVLKEIQVKENWNNKRIALSLGYKTASAFANSYNIRLADGFIKGYYSRERTA
jgi:hypothetical protein